VVVPAMWGLTRTLGLAFGEPNDWVWRVIQDSESFNDPFQ
jgi:hypothetical protein